MGIGVLKRRVAHGVAWLELNRPKSRNALNEELIALLTNAVSDANDDDEVRVVVLSGAGPAFCAGGDIKAMQDNSDPRQAARFARRASDMFFAIENCAKPVVAAVHAYAFGGGTELVAACDVVVATRSARFGTNEVRVGLAPTFSSLRMAQIVGLHNAKYLALTGRTITAAEARRIGLVNIVVPNEALHHETARLAADMADNAPLGLAATKNLMNRSAREGYGHAIEVATRLQASADMAEGLDAIHQKRKPTFLGR